MIKKLFAVTAGAALMSVAFTSASYAGDLSYASSELSTDEGAVGVYKRIQVAAEQKCDGRLNHDSVIKYHAVRERCVSDVVDELVNQVNDPRLDKIHNTDKKSI